MQYPDLQELKDKLYFTSEDVASLLGIAVPSANVLCSRYAKKGLFLRLRKNFYVLPQKFEALGAEEYFTLSSFLQVPSYVSFMTALSYYEATTQVQRDFFENASQKRSASYEREGKRFKFYKLSKKYYFGFRKVRSFFIATKEKAFLDAVYLASFGKYAIDRASLMLEKLDRKKLTQLLSVYPQRTKELANKICGI